MSDQKLAHQKALAHICEVITKLSGPGGCPWDRAQSPESLADYLIEESHELAHAIRTGTPSDVCEELGDLSFLLIFLAHLYEKSGQFSLSDALENNCAKMIRRHPHVYGDTEFADRDSQLKAWEAIKKAEHTAENTKTAGLFASLPPALPPLVKAYRINSKAARAGFTWPEDEEVEQQVESEWLELLDARSSEDSKAQKHEFGDLLFSLVEYGRRLGLKANEALDLANNRFLKRYARMEALAAASGQDLEAIPLDDKDELWEKAKAEETLGM